MLRRYWGHGISLLACLVLCGVTVRAQANDRCAQISDGTIYDADGEPLRPGFDEWGYNWGAHLFFGFYCDAAHDAESCQAYRDVRLIMKWNDAWISKRDCDGDGKLDRHFGFDAYQGSGASLSNLMHGTYDLGRHQCHWLYFTQIEAAPSDASLLDGVWYDADGEEIGPEIWGEFAVTKEKLLDPCGQASQVAPGILRASARPLSPVRPL